METQESDVYVPRALQLDSKQLDDEFCTILITKLSNALSFFEQKLLVQLEPELQTLLKIFLYNFPLRSKRQTVGQALLDIKYDSRVSSKRLHSYSAAVIFISWLKMRQSTFVSLASNDSIKDSIWKVLTYIEIYAQSLEFVNLLSFVVSGRYPTLLERIFKLKLVPKNIGKREVDYSYFTRELLWNGFSDLLSFILPLITLDQFHNGIKMLLPSKGKPATDDPEEVELNQIDLHCVTCKNLAVLPQLFGCKHVACYYCLFSSLSSNGSFQCPLCGEEVFTSEKVFSLANKYRTSE